MCPFTLTEFSGILDPVNIQKLLAELHSERRQVNDVILSLERLSQFQGRKNVPTALSQLGIEGGKRARTVSHAARAQMKMKIKVKSKAAGS